MGLLRHFILAIIANAVALYLVAYFMPEDFIITGGIKTYAILGFAVGFLNTVVKPLLKLITLPLMVLSMGLFLIVINMVILWFLQYLFADVLTSLEINFAITGGLKTYLFGALLLGVFNYFTRWLFK